MTTAAVTEGDGPVLVESTFDERNDVLLQAQRWLLVAVVVLAGVGVAPGLADRYFLVRATGFAIAAVLLAVCSSLRAVERDRIVLPSSWAFLPLAVFVGALAASTLESEHAIRSIIGPYTRYSGVAMYVVYVAIFAFVLRCHTSATVERLARVATAVLGFVSGYGILQFAGLDPVSWPVPTSGFGSELPTEFATFGNVNFASGFVGVLSPLAAWTALAGGGEAWHRRAAALTAGASAIYLALIGSAQGILAFIAGVGLVGAIWLIEGNAGPKAVRRRRAIVISAVLMVATAITAPVAAALARRQLDDAGARERRQLWSTAAEIWADHPVIGHGMGSFEWLFTPNRPRSHAEQNNFLQADAPHNVVLDMGVGGGVLLAGAYLAFVGFVAVILVVGLKRTRGDRRLLLAGFGGAWLGYQVQSMVSIDVPPLAVMHWLAAGAVLVLARPPRAAVIGKALEAHARRPDRRARERQRRAGGRAAPGRSLGGVTIALAAFVSVLALWPITWPLRADRASARAGDAVGRGDLVDELESAKRAVALAPWEPRYWAQKASAYDHLNQLPDARDAGLEAARRASGSSLYALAVAGLAVRLDDDRQARQWLDEALERDPHNPEVQSAVRDTRRLLEDGSD